MLSRLEELRDHAASLAEAGNYRQAVQGFRMVLETAGQAIVTSGASASRRSSSHDCGGKALSSHAAVASAGANALDDRQVSEIHEMLAQCLMELAAEQDAASGGERASGQAGEPEAGAECARALCDEALMHAEEAVRLWPLWADGYVTLGRCCRNMGRLGEAMQALHTAEGLLRKELSKGACSSRGPEAADSSGPGQAVASMPISVDNAVADAGDGSNCAAQQGVSTCVVAELQQQCLEQREWQQRLEEQLSEVSLELLEVEGQWQRQLAASIALPGLVISQDQGSAHGPGCKVWECGLVLAAYLRCMLLREAGQQGGGKPLHVPLLELGSGTGVAGIAAAASGAACLLTDLPAVVSGLLERNARANAGLVQAAGGALTCRPLDWSEVSERAISEGQAGAPSLEHAARWLLGGAAAAPACDGGSSEQQSQMQHAEAAAAHDATASCSYVTGADLVYSGGQVEPLVGLLCSLRAQLGRVAAGHDAPTPTAAAGGAPPPDQGVPHAHSVATAAATATGRIARVVLLLAHKHRSEQVDVALLGALQRARLQVQPVALPAPASSPPLRATSDDSSGSGQACGVQAGSPSDSALASLVERYPSVRLYQCLLWQGQVLERSSGSSSSSNAGGDGGTAAATTERTSGAPATAACAAGPPSASPGSGAGAGPSEMDPSSLPAPTGAGGGAFSQGANGGSHAGAVDGGGSRGGERGGSSGGACWRRRLVDLPMLRPSRVYLDRRVLLLGMGLPAVGKTELLQALHARVANSVYMDKDTVNGALLARAGEAYFSPYYNDHVRVQSYDVLFQLAAHSFRALMGQRVQQQQQQQQQQQGSCMQPSGMGEDAKAAGGIQPNVGLDADPEGGPGLLVILDGQFGDKLQNEFVARWLQAPAIYDPAPDPGCRGGSHAGSESPAAVASSSLPAQLIGGESLTSHAAGVQGRVLYVPKLVYMHCSEGEQLARMVRRSEARDADKYGRFSALRQAMLAAHEAQLAGRPHLALDTEAAPLHDNLQRLLQYLAED